MDRAQAHEQRLRDEALRRQLLAGRADRHLGDGDRRVPAGDCMDCLDQIETARLAALPSATRCIACQADWERGTRRVR